MNHRRPPQSPLPCPADLEPRPTSALFAEPDERCAHCDALTSDIWLDGFCGACHEAGAVECGCEAARAAHERAAAPAGPEGTVAVRAPELRAGDVVVEPVLAAQLGVAELRVEAVELEHRPIRVSFRSAKRGGRQRARRRASRFPPGRWFHVQAASSRS